LFNNREIATAIWLSIFVLWVLTKPNVRDAIANVFSVLLKWKLLVCIAAMVLYTAAIVAVLYFIGFWQLSMTKDTVLWFCFTAFVMVMRYATSRNDDSIFRAVIADSLKLIIFVEFIIGTYVMSLPAELVFVPFITLLVTVDAFAKLDDKYADVAKITTFLVSVIGLAVLGYAIWRAVGDFRNLGTLATIRTVALPPLMSIAFIPFVYCLVVIITYELIFTRFRIGPQKPPDVIRYAKRRIFLHCGMSPHRLHMFAKRPPYELTQIATNADVDRMFESEESASAT
jgi:hypothetical protein